jgi:type VI secretion system protein ImpG
MGREAVRPMGFDDNEALLPAGNRRFSGYRLLQEYFAFPQRFLFVELGGLERAVRQCTDSELDVIVLLDRADAVLDGALDASMFALYCSPAINLFPRRADRIHLTEREYEYQVIPDRTRPMDYEVYDVLEVAGYAEGGERSRTFEPFYAMRDMPVEDTGAYFTLRRVPRMMSERQGSQGPRSGYLGNDAYLQIVDSREAPFRSDLRQLAIETLCTNRDLPLLFATGNGKTDFTLVTGAPVRSVRVIAGPTRPRAPLAEGEAAWRLIGHLSLNYLSLADSDEKQGAAAMRELLALYGDLAEPAVRKQIEGVRSISHHPVLRRVAQGAATSWVRGLEIALTFDEAAFQGSGVFVLGSVLERFFARYVSLNSFTETVLRTVDRGEIARWPARIGNRTLV